MCTYCGTTKYRKIYENHTGIIPKEVDGRTYEIHHIDGNHSNNSPINLVAVPIQEHYDIHYSQGDWAACLLMSDRIKISPEEKSKLASKTARERVENRTHPWMDKVKASNREISKVKNNTHNFQGIRNPVHRLIEDGTFHLLSGEIQKKNNKERIEKGTHNFLGAAANQKRIDQGTHNFLGAAANQKRIDQGTHNFLGGEYQKQLAQQQLLAGTHNSQIKISCLCCQKIFSKNTFGTHNKKCLLRQKSDIGINF